MKRIKTFSNFTINESYSEINLSIDQLDLILTSMEKDVKNCVLIYTNLKKSLPQVINQLQKRSQQKGTSLEAILDEHFLNDPTSLHLLDEFKEIKDEVLQRTKLEDFSRLGRLGKIGLI
jgi:hypothetical protein